MGIEAQSNIEGTWEGEAEVKDMIDIYTQMSAKTRENIHSGAFQNQVNESVLNEAETTFLEAAKKSLETHDISHVAPYRTDIHYYKKALEQLDQAKSQDQE